MPERTQVGGSFRDPNGFVFFSEGTLYRQVNNSYQRHYDLLLSSGLYEELVSRRLLIAHNECDCLSQGNDHIYKVLRPLPVPFISYPYEWCFSQLKDAALVTLDIQKRALAHRMVLKDASAYNIQFLDGKPLLIDTLSFETYEDGRAWVAYRQFCQHFLAPLVLMSRKDIRLSQLLRIYMDGIPLDLAASLLPKRTFFNIGIAMHLWFHARAQGRVKGKPDESSVRARNRLSRRDLVNICDSLQSTIAGLKWDHGSTSWANYYEGDSYLKEGFDNKREIVREFLDIANPKCVWDLGANTGEYSRIASQRGVLTISMDSDPGVVEQNYLQSRRQKEKNLHPLWYDLTNPSAGIGWANDERQGLSERNRADCILALALVHHIAISNNVPLCKIAEYFVSLSEWLIIEFVPKGDQKVQALLASREDVFEDYKQNMFEEVFSEIYVIVRSTQIKSANRILYLMRRRERMQSA